MDTLPALTAAVFLTSVLSGVFGMAGGMVLMLLLSVVLPVREAMLVHGLAQAVANGARFVLLRRHVAWAVVGRYLAAAALVLGVVSTVRLVPDRATVQLVLGGSALLGVCVPARSAPSVRSRHGAALCGAVVTLAQLTAGVSGPLLDVFFVRSDLDRRAIVGTKAFTQTCGHLLKLAYFGVVVGVPGAALPGAPSAFAIAAAAVAGTSLGRRLLERLDDRSFRRISLGLVVVLALVSCGRGVAELRASTDGGAGARAEVDERRGIDYDGTR